MKWILPDSFSFYLKLIIAKKAIITKVLHYNNVHGMNCVC